MGVYRSVGVRVFFLLQKMFSEIIQECQRIGVYGVFGQGIGGQLVKFGKNVLFKRDDLIGLDMSVKVSDLVSQEVNFGFIRFKFGVKMILVNGTLVDVFVDYFVYLQIGYVLFIQGNVVFDFVIFRLVFVLDFVIGEQLFVNYFCIQYLCFKLIFQFFNIQYKSSLRNYDNK